MQKVIGLVLLSITMLNIQATNIAVFCSADDKVCDAFKQSAHYLGQQLGMHGFGLVTGGSRTGLMKELIDGYTTTTRELTHLYGILPEVLKAYNVHHTRIAPEGLHWTETIHHRLATFHELSDAIIVLPGGYGTLHELMDFVVHRQFGLLHKPIILLNLNGYWDNLLCQFATMHAQQLLTENHLSFITIASSEDECMSILLTHSDNADTHSLHTHYWEK
jgi:uncharacterized protein (TIGR00730 family)